MSSTFKLTIGRLKTTKRNIFANLVLDERKKKETIFKFIATRMQAIIQPNHYQQSCPHPFVVKINQKKCETWIIKGSSSFQASTKLQNAQMIVLSCLDIWCL